MRGWVRWGDSERMAGMVQGGVEERRMTRIQQVQVAVTRSHQFKS